MNIILAEPEEIVDSTLEVADYRADHIVKVLRAKEGQQVRVGVVNGNSGVGTIRAIKRKYPRSVIIETSLDKPMSQRPMIDLVVAMARPIMMKRILSQATALGVGSFHIIHANRVEKSFWESTMVDQESLYQHLIHGLEQAVDTRLPEVVFHRRFKPFIEDVFPAIRDKYSHHVLAHPGGEHRLKDLLSGGQGRVLLAVGPEGGWVDYEVEKFQEAGFATCSMGDRILKVDTAVVALHARVSEIYSD